MSWLEEKSEVLKRADTEAHLRNLYGAEDDVLRRQQARYRGLLARFQESFGPVEGLAFFSAPGRTEIGGNHTDHNNGRVLAASVNLDALCAAAPRADNRVRFHSEGYPELELDLTDTAPRPEEEGTTAALIRGVADGMKQAGYRIGGFDAAVTSTVAGGSGLSSSAAVEVMLTGVLDGLFNRFDMPFVQRAQISRRAENLHFGKPSGLLDQMASAAGGLVTVDFEDDAHPRVEALQYDFARKGYALVVVGTGGSHADLTDHYAAIPQEMKAVAACFGKKTLRGVTEGELVARAGALRQATSDRAVMRAFHFVRENERVPRQVAALKEDRIEDFLRLIRESGRSSFMYLQNIYAPGGDQSLSLALCMAESMLEGDGAWRIHGGGFAGTTLNFVPAARVDAFVSEMDKSFGPGACHVLNVRPCGADRILL
ncbi:MAG: galactokinase [Clostridia bacterium]|nr:galactokinase [Clostridia bacterium]